MKAPALLSLPLLLGFACTAKNPAYEKQFAQLNENIVILQSERDRLEERIAVLEAERDQARSERPKVPGTFERPPLKVVQLVPPEAEPEPTAPVPSASERVPEPAATVATEDSADRVLIQGSGDDIEQVTARP
jgi:hypothetical protein